MAKLPKRQRDEIKQQSGNLFVLAVSGASANIAVPANSKFARVTQTGANTVNIWYDMDQAAVVNAQTTIPQSQLEGSMIINLPTNTATLHAIADAAGSVSVEFFED